MEKNLRGYLFELLGTFSVVFVAAAAVCANQVAINTGNQHLAPGMLGIALAYGLAYAAALAVVLPHSEGFLNPAMTLMQWVFKRLDGSKTLMLILMQLLGAAVAGGLIYLAFTSQVLTNARMGTPHLNFRAFGEAGPTKWVMFMGALIEAVGTFILAFVVYGSIVDPRFLRMPGPWGKRLTPLWVGLILTAITFGAFSSTGAAMNPARWFGTVIWENAVPALAEMRPFQDNGLPYWFGPIAGALLAGVVFNMLILSPESESSESNPPHSVGPKSTSASAALARARK
jgi:glycerol uptake facilitator-like aquaporin